jgi:hypothetical protein
MRWDIPTDTKTMITTISSHDGRTQGLLCCEEKHHRQRRQLLCDNALSTAAAKDFDAGVTVCNVDGQRNPHNLLAD